MSHGTYLPRTPSQPHRRVEAPSTALVLRLLLVVLSATALGVSGFLAWLALTGGIVPGCSDQGVFNCDMVLSTKWSRWFNLPVALPAASLYAGILALSVFTFGFAPAQVRRGAWRLIAVLAASAALAGIWFIVLQGFIVKHWCPWCLAVHCSGVVLAVLVFAFAAPARRVPLLTGLLACCSVGLLVAGQMVSKPPQTFTQSTITIAQIDDFDDTPQTEENEKPPLEHHTSRPVIEDNTPELELSPRDLAEENTGQQLEQPRETVSETSSGDESQATPERPSESQEAAPTTREGDTSPEDSAEQTAEQPAAVEPTPEPQTPERMVTIAEGLEPIDLHQQLILGSPDAEQVIFEMFDYTCPHCREMAPKIEAIRERYGDDVAIVLLPVPMNPACNRFINRGNSHHTYACEITRYALAIWIAKPEEFEAYHHWLMEGEHAPNRNQAQARAGAILGSEELLELSRSDEVAQRIQNVVNLYGQLNRGMIPKFIIGDQLIQGRVAQEETLYKIIEENLPLEPVSE